MKRHAQRYAFPLSGVLPVVIRESAPLVVALKRGFDVTYVLTFSDVEGDMDAYSRAVDVTRAFERAAHDAAEDRYFSATTTRTRTRSIKLAHTAGSEFAGRQPVARKTTFGV